MARFTVYLSTFSQHPAINLHAWDPAGDIRDVRGSLVTAGLYRFDLDMSAKEQDLTQVLLKFWYPGESNPWERQDFVRRVPSTTAREIWTVEFSPRCLTSDPRAIGALPVGTAVTIGALTAKQFAGGHVYVWDPATAQSRMFPETGRDEANRISYFRVSLDGWMTGGFHFKLVSADGSQYEPDRANRFWRPIDGQTLFVKSGQVEVRPTAPVSVNVPISVIYPIALEANAVLAYGDCVDDFQGQATRSGLTPIDADFVAVNFVAPMYPDSFYNIKPQVGASNVSPSYEPQWSLLLRVPGEALPGVQHALLGVSEWYEALPTRDAEVELHVHANPGSTFGASVQAPWHLGFAQRTNDERLTPLAGTVVALAAEPGLWKAKLRLFRNVPQWVGTLEAGLAVETRADGPSLSQRDIRVTTAGPTVLHTIDGQTGVSAIAPAASVFGDVSLSDRARLLKCAFSPQIVDAGVFATHEMPHGAVWQDDTLWFVLLAPHTIQASVILFNRAASTSTSSMTKKVPMQLTHDLRYWWCKVPKAELADASLVEYRFSLDGSTEVLDPASRCASSAQYVWAEPSEGPEGAWSVVVNRSQLAAAAMADGWQTPFWNEFMIYELHPQRFTNRNNGAAVLSPFAQVETELQGYLADLPVTALELLPINEFPKYISWGYNSSLYFAIESFYGGPSACASLVKAAHRAGKAVVLDVVYNHLTDSPMQAIAKDIFADGKTQWGDMVNYDHPACLEFFRQALVYLFDTFQIDGFRFDATQAIVNGDRQNGFIIQDGRVGSGGGWSFLQALHTALDKAATACGRRYAYAIAESNPDDWAMDGHVVDGQWDFDFLGKVGWAATEAGDAAPDLANVLMTWRGIEETIRCEETHDSCSTQDPNAKRIAARGPWGTGMRMSKACGALSILTKGVPMFFMGAEAGETKAFLFDVPQSGDVLPLDTYCQPGTENRKVLDWYRALLGLRKNWSNGFGSNDTPYIGKGNRTIAFTRDDGRFFVIATFGTPDARQSLGWLGMPSSREYKEIFNSTWPAYNVNFDDWSDNGGYGARLSADSIANLPSIGAVILERI